MSQKKIDLAQYPQERIRNFSIIAHIDHGKSTMADRLLEFTGTLSTRKKNEQYLDRLQVEKERGITVKAQTASLFYTYNGEEYLINLIDTPGHVDFSYEVSRSLYACQGALLLVDAVQGVQAQTMANFYMAFEHNLAIIPVMNKIDLPTADTERVGKEIYTCFDLDPEQAIKTSAKNGIGIDELLQAIVQRIPAPTGDKQKSLRALLFDSWFDEYRGIICMVEIIDGSLKKGDLLSSAFSGQSYEVLEAGILYPELTSTGELFTGQVGYIITGMRNVKEAMIGDTFYQKGHPVEALPGFKEPKPMVFAGIYPIDNSEYEAVKDAIEKLTLNDPSVFVEKETSVALGHGFRCGFLGLLHMDVFRQRLEQEYEQSIISTTPSVLYQVELKTGETVKVDNPADFPDAVKIERIFEPIVKATMILPDKYLGSIITLCQDRRGVQEDLSYIGEGRAMVRYRLPLCEIATNFYDKLKSLTAGYASLDYELAGFEESDMVKMDILLNGNPVDALSCIVHRDKATFKGRVITEKLKQVIPRQMFALPIQAAIGSKVLARETISAFRKDVVAHCYGGDTTRKKKLLEKQKEGKKKMKMVGTVELSQETFLAVLKDDE